MNASAPLTLGVTIATNIGRHMDRLGWEFEDLAAAAGVEWWYLIDHRADATHMDLNTLGAVAAALGVCPAELAGGSPQPTPKEDSPQ